MDVVKAIFKLLASMKKKHHVKILVHGSSGVGRTGTFIALFELMEVLDAKLCEYKQQESYIPVKGNNIKEASVDIFNCVFNLRKQRCEMVRRNKSFATRKFDRS